MMCRLFGHSWRYTFGLLTGLPFRVCTRCLVVEDVPW